MDWLTKILVQIGFIQLTEAKVRRWVNEKNVNLLIFSLINGSYHVRIRAIQGIASLNAQEAIPVLFQSAQHDHSMVAEEALKAIYKLDVQGTYATKVSELRDYLDSLKPETINEPKRKYFIWPARKPRIENLEKFRGLNI